MLLFFIDIAGTQLSYPLLTMPVAESVYMYFKVYGGNENDNIIVCVQIMYTNL